MCIFKKDKTLKLIKDVLTKGVYYQDRRYKKERTFLDPSDPQRRKKERIIVDLDKQCFTLVELIDDSPFSTGYQVESLPFEAEGKYWGVLNNQK